jgi:hypothetical protein
MDMTDFERMSTMLEQERLTLEQATLAIGRRNTAWTAAAVMVTVVGAAAAI